MTIYQDFNLTAKEAYQYRNRYLIQNLTKEISNWQKTEDIITKIFSKDNDIYYFTANIISDLNKKLINLRKKRKTDLSSFDLQAIKELPIGDFLLSEPHKDNAKQAIYTCLNHSPDNHPSMVWFKNNNRVKCFSCGYNGSVIDVVMLLNNFSFLEACNHLEKFT